jgi:hypothetical protein
MFLLDLGPRTSKLIKQGTVEIDEDNLYGWYFKNKKSI